MARKATQHAFSHKKKIRSEFHSSSLIFFFANLWVGVKKKKQRCVVQSRFESLEKQEEEGEKKFFLKSFLLMQIAGGGGGGGGGAEQFRTSQEEGGRKKCNPNRGGDVRWSHDTLGQTSKRNLGEKKMIFFLSLLFLSSREMT